MSNNKIIIESQENFNKCIKNGVTRNLHIQCHNLMIYGELISNSDDILTWIFGDNGELEFIGVCHLNMYIAKPIAKKCTFYKCHNFTFTAEYTEGDTEYIVKDCSYVILRSYSKGNLCRAYRCEAS